MNLNLILEEIKVKDFEGTIEILKTVKKAERIETIISKHQYKLEKKSSQDLLNSCQIDSINYKYFKRNIFEKIFLKKDINHLLRLISKESSYYSWILCPTIFLNDVKSSDIFLKKLVFEWEMEYLLFGNFNSATIIKNGEFMQIIQNSPLKMIKIS
jgi:hypothetical protein